MFRLSPKPDGIEIIIRHKHIEIMHLHLKNLKELYDFMKEWLNVK